LGESAAIGATAGSVCKPVTILNGTYFVRSENGAGIGASAGGGSRLNALTVVFGTFSIALGGAGIGVGE
jgi:hypothetical protein